MALQPYQMQWNGLTFGQGTSVGVEVIDGFDSFNMQVQDLAIPRKHGDVPGLHVVESRDVMLELYSVDAVAFDTILNSFLPTDEPQPLYLREEGDTDDRLVFARVTGRWFTRNPVHKFKKMATIRLKLADPRWYYSLETSKTATIYDPTGGGIDFNKDGNTDYLGDPNAGEIVCNNEGNFEANPLLRITGPSSSTMTGSTLQNITNGSETDFTYTTPMVSGDNFYADFRRIVTVDPGDEPYIRLGAASRYGDWDLPRTPFYLSPGDNVLRYTGTGTTTGSVCVVSWLHTSL